MPMNSGKQSSIPLKQSAACILLLLMLGLVDSFQTVQLPRRAFRLDMSTADVDGSSNLLHSMLKKPSKALTVGVEYVGKTLSANEISILSMQLRRCKVSAIWCQSVDAVKEFSLEQQSAKGTFPGPCLVVYHGPPEEAASALSAGASAVVMTTANFDNSPLVQGEIVWKVTSKKDVESILEHTGGNANVFWVDSDGNAEEDLAALVGAIPAKALWIAAVEPMQADGAEILRGKAYKTQGCGSILVKDASVGDSEDLEYAQFIVNGLTSKASSEFKFTGLTGSTNGHFGGVQANSSVKWRRPTRS